MKVHIFAEGRIGLVLDDWCFLVLRSSRCCFEGVVMLEGGGWCVVARGWSS